MTTKWTPPDLSQLASGWWIAADPSIAATGLVILSVGPLGVIVASAKKLGVERQAKTGWDDTFIRSDRMTQVTVYNYLSSFPALGDDLHIVHEAPLVGEGFRPESAILGSAAFRNACYLAFHAQPAGKVRTYTVEAPATKGSWAKYICGNGKASKQEAHEGLKKLFPQLTDAAKYVTNEATRDALCIALYAANRRWIKDGQSRVVPSVG